MTASRPAWVEYFQDRYGYSLSQVVAEQHTRVELGDLAFPFCFELAKKLKRAPRQIAAEIVQDLPDLPGCGKSGGGGPRLPQLLPEAG